MKFTLKIWHKYHHDDYGFTEILLHAPRTFIEKTIKDGGFWLDHEQFIPVGNITHYQVVASGETLPAGEGTK